MIQLKYYYAQVIDNDDAQKLARIQIRLLPEMKDVQVKYLPWMKPFTTGGMNIPQIDEYVWVIFLDKYFKEGFYINDIVFLENFFDYDDIESDINKISEVGTITYPDLKCRQYADGTIEFHNVKTSARGVYHSSGAYQVIDPDGNIYSKDKTGNKISMDTSGVLIEDKSGGKIEMKVTGVTIKNDLEIKLETLGSELWKMNMIPNCIFSGSPHSPPITGLKG